MFLEVYPQVYGASTIKYCPDCQQYKEIDQFASHKGRRDGLQRCCKACIREYRKRNRTRVLEQNHAYYDANRDMLRAKSIEYGQSHKEEKKQYNREYYQNNRQAITEKKRQYEAERRDEILASRRRKYQLNRDALLEQKRTYYALHKEEMRERARVWYENNRETVAKYAAEQNQREDIKLYKKAKWHERRALKRQSSVPVTANDIRAIRKSQTDRKGRLICWACGNPIIGNEPPPHAPNSPPMPPHLDHWIPLKHGGKHAVGNLHYLHGLCNLTKGSKLPSELGRLI